jgi:CheY-like chemotaxis protein
MQQRLTGKRILIVEDEYLIAADLADGIEAAGAEVIGPLGTVPQALSELADETHPAPHAASLDVNLRGVEVFPVADALRARGVPFVFCTGYDLGNIPARYSDVPRFEKPVDMTLLIGKLCERMRSD